MNQATITTVMSIAAAAILAAIQAAQHVTIETNHESTHERIDDVQGTVMNTDVVQLHVDAFNKQQAIQDDRLDSLENEHPPHIHDDEED